MGMSEADLKEIEERANKSSDYGLGEGHGTYRGAPRDELEFIARAKPDILRLIAEVKRLDGELMDAEHGLQLWRTDARYHKDRMEELEAENAKLRKVAVAVIKYKSVYGPPRIMCRECGCEACVLDEALEEARFGDE